MGILQEQIEIVKRKHLSDVVRLTDALKKYGRCKCRWTPEHGYKCRCGFDELVFEYEQKIKNEKQ